MALGYIAIGLGLVWGASALAEPAFASRFIFPPQEKHVHASSIVECPNGDLLACWFHGSGERWADDVVIQGARRPRGASAWGPVFVMADTPGFPDCNPVLFVDPQARLWLFWVCVVANRWEHSLLKYRRAEDYLGAGPPRWSWQDVIVLKPGDDFPAVVEAGFKALGFDQACWAEYALPYDRLVVEAAREPFKRQKGWMTRNHPTVLPSGRILLPLYSDGFNLSLVALSDDRGETWRPSAPMAGVGPIQPSIVRRQDGSLVAYLRDGGGPPHRVQVSTSTDQGETWTPAVDTELPNPSASLEVCRLASGRWLMVHNDTERGRHRLAVSLSADEGRSWAHTRALEQQPGGSFSYPSMIQGADGRIHLTYSHRAPGGGATINHVELEEGWVRLP
ncbi:MAG: hypothetical protein FJ387_05860 [Verrucomicrobia bacterium]|nr:hypothetical protein [Verrucomicrobiota bacterium]